jgi:hypothetical protein
MVAGRVALRAVASDDVGVVRVEFYRNRTPIAVSGGPDFLATWNTAGKPNGWYLLTARAVDAAGNSKRSTVAVRVAN